MIKIGFKDINGLLGELLKMSMREVVDKMWNKSEEELIKSFEMVMATPDDEDCSSLFTMMHMVGLVGTVLVSKYGKDEKELMKMLKDSDALFVKEIRHEN